MLAMTERELFLAALELDPAQRATYLDAACGTDLSLRLRLDGLLQSHAEAGNFLDKPAQERPDDYPTMDADPGTADLKTCVGPYKLLQEIGAGGMGTVFLAEQQQPIRRSVAVKVIKPGMDSQQVIARFEAERQALALMEHPNIAHVLEAGSTEAGRPYFVMELVKGVPITAYCDEQRLTPRQRLELFVPVCQAVQHAHQKGVIHRDLKPSNVLVAEYDDRAVPKIIDFGIAKAVAERLTERTLVTGFGHLVGTLEYMSPEQAKFNALDIDTRSDIYALGVLLYELLTGSPPFDRKRLRDTPLDESLRIIREEEPPRPSTHLRKDEGGRMKDESKTTKPKRWHRRWPFSSFILHPSSFQELDWIVMKALDKERARRYQTADSLARDLQHYLDDEPVVAGPPSTRYRFGKLVRRHRRWLAAASAFVLFLIVATAVSVSLAVWAMFAEKETCRERDNAVAAQQLADQRLGEAIAARTKEVAANKQAEQEKQIAQAVLSFLLQKLLRQADPEWQADALLQAGGTATHAKVNPTIRELLDRAAQEVTPDKIERRFPKQPQVQAPVLVTIGNAYMGVGEYGQAVVHLQRAYHLREQQLGPDHLLTLSTLDNLAAARAQAGQRAEAIRLFEQLRDQLVAQFGAGHLYTLTALTSLGSTYYQTGKRAEAIRLFEQVRDQQVAQLGLAHRSTLNTLHLLAMAYTENGKLAEAIRLFEQVREQRVAQLGADHPDTLATLHHLAAAYRQSGKLAVAIQLFEKVRAQRITQLGADHPHTLQTLRQLAMAYWKSGKRTEAIRLHEHVRDKQVAQFGANHPDTLATLEVLALVYQAHGKLEQAIRLFEQVREQRVAQLGADHPDTLSTLTKFAVASFLAGKRAEAIRLFEQVREQQIARLGADHSDTLTTLDNLAAAYRETGELAKAIRLFEQVRDQRIAQRGADHKDTLATLHHLALAYQATGKQAEAIGLLEQVRDRRITQLGANDLDTLHTLHELALAYGKAGKLTEAIRLFEQVREQRIAQFGADHPDTLATLSGLARAYWSAKRLDRAVPLYEQVVQLMKGKVGVDHPETLMMMGSLGGAYHDAGQLPEAVAVLEDAVRRARKLPPPWPRQLGWISQRLATTYFKSGHFDRAEPLFQELFDQARQQFGADHPKATRAMAQLGLNWLQQNKFADAERLLRECRGLLRKSEPDASIFTTQLMLGDALLGQKKYAEAEPLLLETYEAMKQRQDMIPKGRKIRLLEALERLVRLYDEWGKKDEAAKWRQKGAAHPATRENTEKPKQQP
jgi:serine/threonine protein kinase